MPASRLNVLVLSDFAGSDANVVRDYLYSFNQHSRHQFCYLHSWSKYNFRRLNHFDFDRFDAIVLFWNYYWIGCEDPLNRSYVPTWVSERIANSRAVKIQFLQDEYREVRLANHVMNRFGINVMFSCVAPSDQDLFYPKSLIPSLAATYPVLTGYVPSYLEKINWTANKNRTFDIGYRSRKLPYHLGSLGQEKTIIADQFQRIADQYGFSANISVKETDRIYGDRWLEFMKACRFSLGTESGASVVDFDGQIRRKCQSYLHENPTATFDELKREAFEKHDGKVVIQTISPRIFEAAAFENTLVLHEGHYEGMLQPDIHYIAVKKDYSNVTEVVERMKDHSFCERLAQNAKNALISSKQYNYRSFVKSFDHIVEKHSSSAPTRRGASRVTFYMMNYLNNDRILPYRGSYINLPHTWDLLYHFNNYAPYSVVMMCSLGLILSLVRQAPLFTTNLIRSLLSPGNRSSASLAGLLKDLRMLALFFQMRGGIRADHCPTIEQHLSYCVETKQLLVRTVPYSKENAEDSHRHALRLSQEGDLLGRLVLEKSTVTITWDNRLLGNALPLKTNRGCNYNIDLNQDCIYPFQCLNQLQLRVQTENCESLRNLFLGNWREPSWFGKCVALMLLVRVVGSSVLKKSYFYCAQKLHFR